MEWLEKLRAKPKEEKIWLLWITTIIAAVVLIGTWILIGNYNNGADKNLDLFKTIETGIKNFKLDKSQLTLPSEQSK
ncbi:MAG: hypothetical protein G01um101477_378 [Candidatus Doudnabacteria bacterium Gr01-1014_77]|uniref:Uncharacterized protein n=1 Tax=Candidatus Doudnabacteria bacterium Gr01-1014_77 TaxID=2017133 RepID=A0A554JBK7_9BACT|nr:MAG: hypothetical protein G01um101477_378 [Candidatus Doudnabacteria bacterium Gr01-1014_77]